MAPPTLINNSGGTPIKSVPTSHTHVQTTVTAVPVKKTAAIVAPKPAPKPQAVAKPQYVSGTLTTSQQTLVNALSTTPGVSPEIASAMLVGAQGESYTTDASGKTTFQYQYSKGTGGGGYFGFTPPYSNPYYETAPANQQVQYELTQYQQAVSGTGQAGATEKSALGFTGVPNWLTGASKAEYIAIAAERPLNDTTELQKIAVSWQPTEYGGAPGAQVQNWLKPTYPYNVSILQELAAFQRQTGLQASRSVTGLSSRLQ